MKEFRCAKCLRIKKSELYAYSVKSNSGKRKVCSNCAEQIKKAMERRD